jgi:hypothetical protein
MATLTHPKGRTVVVPDETVEYYTSKGWSVAGQEAKAAKSSDGPVVIPDGDPSEEWSNKQLDAYAEREGLDFAGVKNKGDRLTAIAEGRKVNAGDGSDSGDE